ncbi:uncharacterized protein LOC110828250 isoform X1 [Zootermopsis nevadensis]|uniref:uncharacterized protein LOC110828250 isoform X1 n=1 Tax=Zootermopsis nevadensis TaxID=136037 RepID=UPI000B8E96B1|nr:uncharacterized protein LOC110828250 isoform X1 [Zootermopsis nevadensis]XP_021916491.1 uncharacterized protein LOC110828250 isoform X1 [Zootermopsis nevadensis]XP_021916492.1 uncharacterized protein LOC110828250 isoform X1 [Zootermopsis nevadensis]
MACDNHCDTYKLTKQEFEYLLSPQLGSDLKVLEFKMQALTQPGDNYGSTILAAELTIQQGHEQNTLPLVVKLVPPSEFLREAFDIGITFNKEVNAYKLVSPQYKQLQIEKGIPESKLLDVFPKFYGARTNTQGNSNAKADNTAVLILENLKLIGYHTGDRRKGLDLKHMELGVNKLARFHALSVALKILKPNTFKETVLKSCDRYVIGGVTDDEVAEKWFMSTFTDVKCIPECLPYLERIEMSMREDLNEKRNPSPPPPKEPFAAFVHCDFWVNNMMFLYETEDNDENQPSKIKTPINMKFVDFQVTLYDSPIRDLIFFIYSSATIDVIKHHCDDLIRLYYNEFIDCLSGLACDTNPFSIQNFQDELNTNAPKEFHHLLYMAKIISADESQVPELSDCDADAMFKSNFGGKFYEEKFKFIVKDFVQRGWL